MNIGIIGAGIGGLTAAIAAEQLGLNPQVFERAAEFKAVGAGITLGANAMKVFSRLGLSDRILSHGNRLEEALLKDASGEVLSRINLIVAGEQCNSMSVAIHRARLHEVLLGELSDVSLGHEAIQLDSDSTQVTCHFKHGSSYCADRIIVADGVRSTLREQILPLQPVRHANQFCWRGVTNRKMLNQPATVEKSSGVELWGKGARFGYVPINPDEIYWFAVVSDPLINFDTSDAEALAAIFEQAFTPVASQLIRSTESKTIIAQPIIDRRPVDLWHRGQIVFLGDAIHPTTPNMGQGAAMAIESAYVLAQSLQQNVDAETAYQHYTKVRSSRTRQVTNQSWTIGNVAHTKSAWAASLRTTAIKLVPDRLQQRALANFFSAVPD
tara:strand:- start:14711 stop:15859 length:1149 start_codon:yes stop_codon:yes gene_type:complete